VNQPKQHHYLPESYLYGFTNDRGLLWVYDWELDEIREQSPHNTCKQNNFNTILNEDGSKNLEVEGAFASIEGAALPVIKSLIQGKQMEGQQLSDLALFVAGMYSRIPAFREMYTEGADRALKESLKMAVKTEEDALKFLKGDKSIPPSFALDFIQNERYELVPHKNAIMEITINMMMKMHEIFYSQEWCIMRCNPKQAFVTSDAPLTLYANPGFPNPNPFGGHGVATPGVEKRFSLSSQLMLVILDRGDRTQYGTMNYEGVRHFNEFTAARSDRFLIARDKALLESLIAATKHDHAHSYGVDVQVPMDGIPGIIAISRSRKSPKSNH
jgi:hypothetical protein